MPVLRPLDENRLTAIAAVAQKELDAPCLFPHRHLSECECKKRSTAVMPLARATLDLVAEVRRLRDIAEEGWDLAGALGYLGESPLEEDAELVDWKAAYETLHGGASPALHALRAGDTGSALSALEKAFRGLEAGLEDENA